MTEGALKADIAHVLMNRTFAATGGAGCVTQLDSLFESLRRNGTEEIIEAEDMDKYSRLGKDILKFDGKYYQLTDQRIPYHWEQGLRPALLCPYPVCHCAGTGHPECRWPGYPSGSVGGGLPPHYGAQHLEFSQYFLGRGVTNFTYQDKPYSILIDDVGCYPQSYAAAATIIRTLQDAPRALIVDIGGFTADYLQVKNGEGDLSICDSLEKRRDSALQQNSLQSQRRAGHFCWTKQRSTPS